MKHLFMVFFLFLFSLGLKAQQPGPVSLNLYGGYTFKDEVNFDGFYGYVEEAFQYGGGLEFFLHSTKSLELKYLRMDTDLPLYGPLDTKLNEGAEKGSVSYLLIGGNNYFGNSTSKAIPYAGFDIGIGFVDMKDGGNGSGFAWDAKLGVQIKTPSSVSFKLQAYIQSISGAVGTDFYVYPGGAVIAVPDYASIFQFGLGAVLCFNFK